MKRRNFLAGLLGAPLLPLAAVAPKAEAGLTAGTYWKASSEGEYMLAANGREVMRIHANGDITLGSRDQLRIIHDQPPLPSFHIVK